MKRVILIYLFVFLPLHFNASAQLENIPLITVTGESYVKVKPDHVVLGIRIEKEINVNSQGFPVGFEIFKTEDTKIRLFDFEDRNLSETFIQADSTLYIKEIFITINDLAKLDKYLLELYKLGYHKFIFFDYRIKNYKEIKIQAKKKAIRSAQKQAKLLAKELAQDIGKAHVIEEVEYRSYNWYNIHDHNELEAITFKEGAGEYVIEPGYIVITSKIKVSFDLIKK